MDYRKLIILCLFILGNLVSNAHAFSEGTFPASSVGNVTTFGNGTVGGGNLGSASFSFASDGTLTAKGPVTFNSAGAAKVTGEVAAKVTKAAAAKAIANFAFKALPGALLLLSTAQLLDELGFGFGSGPGAAPITKQQQTGGEYYIVDWGPAYTFGGGQAACTAWETERYRYYPDSNPKNATFKGGLSCYAGTGTGSYGDVLGRKAITGTAQVPATRQDFEDAIAQKSGWPASSQLAQATTEAVKSGEAVQAQPQAVTGPLQSPGAKNTTKNPDGTTTTTTTTNNYNYEGNKVTVTTTTVTQNYSNTGVPTGTPKVTTKEPVVAAETPPQKDLCEKYPTIAACAKLDTPDAKEVKNKDVSVSITPDSGWGPASGTCPAPRVLALHGLTTEFSWQPMCDFASGIRGVILAVAWLIAAGSVIGMARKE